MGMEMEMEGMEGMEREEIEQLLPYEMPPRQQEEEEAVRHAIERREALIRDGIDPNLASNFEYDYSSIYQEEDHNAGEYILRSHLPHSLELSHFFSTLV